MLNDNEIVSDESQFTSGLKDYFSKLGRELDEHLPAHNKPIPGHQQSRTVSSILFSL